MHSGMRNFVRNGALKKQFSSRHVNGFPGISNACWGNVMQRPLSVSHASGCTLHLAISLSVATSCAGDVYLQFKYSVDTKKCHALLLLDSVCRYVNLSRVFNILISLVKWETLSDWGLKKFYPKPSRQWRKIICYWFVNMGNKSN